MAGNTLAGSGISGVQNANAKEKWVVPADRAQKSNPIPATEASWEAGRKIYMARCAPCHGTTGNGDGADAIELGIQPPRLSDPKLRAEPDGALYWKITTGRKPMPDYGRRLSSTDRWNVVNYVRTLSREIASKQ